MMPDTACHAGAEASDERFTKARDAVFSTNVVRDYVATLTDRSVPRRLRNQNRNQSFSKVALDTREGKDKLCESDDLVGEYDCHYK